MSYQTIRFLWSRFVRFFGAWLAGHGLRVVATQAGVDQTARRYVEAAVAAGLDRPAVWTSSTTR